MNPASNSNFLQDTLALPFKDSNSTTKFLIGAALIFASTVIPFVPILFFLGYLYRIHNRVATEKNGPVLPEWDDWGKLMMDGLKYMGAVVVFMLPVIILIGGGYFVLFGSFAGLYAVDQMTPESAPLSMLMVLMEFGGLAVIMLGVFVSLPLGMLMPAALGHMSAKNDFGAAFRINEWGKILRANLAGYLLAVLIVMGLTIVATLVIQFLYFTIIFCCVMPFAMSAFYYYLGVVTANSFADAYVTGQAKFDLSQAKIGLPAASILPEVSDLPPAA